MFLYGNFCKLTEISFFKNKIGKGKILHNREISVSELAHSGGKPFPLILTSPQCKILYISFEKEFYFTVKY